MTFAFGDSRLPDRFWDKVEPEPNTGCWLWSGSGRPQGYGSFYWAGKDAYPHRLAYEIATNSTIPIRFQIDHLCRQTWCCNPAHLEMVPPRVNVRRGRSIAAGYMKRHCCPKCKGPFTFSITAGRYCVPCKKAYRRAYRERTGK